jgi:phenylacetate-CoA ligase
VTTRGTRDAIALRAAAGERRAGRAQPPEIGLRQRVEIEGVEPHFQIIVERTGALDEMTLLVEVSGDILADRMVKMIELQEKIQSRIQATLGLPARVKLVEPKTLERFTGKAERVVDKRKM